MYSKFTAGVKVAVTPVYVTAPETGVAPCFRVNEKVEIVSGSIASLNVAVISLLVATFVTALAGIVELEVGAVVSTVAPVVKLHTSSTPSALPARSLASVVTIAV